MRERDCTRWIDITDREAVGEPISPSDAALRVSTPALRWIYGTDKVDGKPAIMHMTFNTPWNASQDKQCGKVLYSDFHVVLNGNVGALPSGVIFPMECDTMPMSPQEKALEFMLFDLSSCIQNDTLPPQRPAQ